MKILDTCWFTNRDGSVGIVRVKTEYHGIKYYIGYANGLNEEQDAKYIADWGSTFDVAAGNALFGLNNDEF